MKTILAMLFATATLYAAAQDTSVIKMEYFMDTDPGVGNATSLNIPSASDVTFPFTVNVSSYSIGYHKLYIRTRDNLGRWSLTSRNNIEVIPAVANNNVVKGEYFIDSDPGFGAGEAITVSTPDTAVLQNFTAVLSGLTEGYHKLYGRFRDTHGNWSQTFRKNIEVIKGENNLVINGEYFFKTDNGFGDCSPVVFATPSADGSFSFNIPASQIPAGADSLYLRVRDDIENRWSLTKVVDINAVLPLTLLSFTAIKHLNIAELTWQTAHEVNTAYFNVQRSTDAVNFITVGKVAARPGNGLQNDYLFADDIASMKAGNVYYRLQMTDNDGRFTYSRVGYITINADGINITLYPNPAHSYFVIANYENIDVSKASIVVRDMAGRMLINQKLNNATEQKINIASLAKGLYTVSIVTPGNVHTEKLLVQ